MEVKIRLQEKVNSYYIRNFCGKPHLQEKPGFGAVVKRMLIYEFENVDGFGDEGL